MQPASAHQMPAILNMNSLVEVSMPRKPRPKVEHVTRDIGLRVARVRKERGVTQVQLAEHLGVSQPNISAYEHGVLRLPSDLLLKIAEILKVSSDELLGLTAPREPAVGSLRLRRRLERIVSLPKRDREALTRLLDAFLGRTDGARVHP